MAKKILGAAALTAALAGGGALGALLGTPSLTAAQEEAPSTTAPAPDDTAPAPPESGSAEGQDEGKDCGDGLGGRARRAIGANLSVAADALGMTTDELRDELRDGASIASVAEERGVDVQTVIDALVASATSKIDEKVASGDLDPARAEELKAELPERVQALVEREGGARLRGPHGHGPRGHRHGAPDGDGGSEDEQGS